MDEVPELRRFGPGRAARTPFHEKVLTWQARMALEERLLHQVEEMSSRVE